MSELCKHFQFNTKANHCECTLPDARDRGAHASRLLSSGTEEWMYVCNPAEMGTNSYDYQMAEDHETAYALLGDGQKEKCQLYIT